MSNAQWVKQIMSVRFLEINTSIIQKTIQNKKKKVLGQLGDIPFIKETYMTHRPRNLHDNKCEYVYKFQSCDVKLGITIGLHRFDSAVQAPFKGRSCKHMFCTDDT